MAHNERVARVTTWHPEMSSADESRGVCRHEAVRGGAAGPDAGQGAAGARRAALRHLRLRPARPRALRRPRRGDGGARLRRVHADRRRPPCWATSSSARCASGAAAHAGVPRGRPRRRRSRWSARRPGRAPDRALAAGAGRVRRAGAGRAVDVVRGPQRAVARRRRAHRADGGGAARGQQVVDVSKPRRRDRAGLRPGRPRGDLLAQGARRAHDRGLRPVGRPTRPGDPLRRGRRRRPDRGVAVRRRPGPST